MSDSGRNEGKSYYKDKKAKAKWIEDIPGESSTKGDKKWRKSAYHKVNPRSSTYVRRDTAPERLGSTYLAGAVAGPVGASYARTRNLRQDNVRSYRKKDGAPATGYVGYADVGGYRHADPKKLRRKADVKKSFGISAFGVEH